MSEQVNPEDIEVHHGLDGNGATGVYVKGKLVWAQDYGADEKVYDLLGVTQVYDSGFMLGQGKWSGAAKTLQEIENYERERDALLKEATRLEEEAEKILQEARALRSRT